LIDAYLSDNCTAWEMQQDGSFVRRIPEEENVAVQARLIESWHRNLLTADS
jgi:polyphosphate kinase